MAASNPIEILLRHDQWATRELILTCQKLEPQQLDRKFEMGPGSLRATITHMIAAIGAWTDTLARQPMRPRADHGGIIYTPEQLESLHKSYSQELIAISSAHPLDEIVTRTRDGQEYSFTRGAVITHVTTHGTHHRAQCLNMLRHLGVQPLPPSSVTEWVRFGE